MLADVVFGSFFTELGGPRHVRFPTGGDRTADIAGGLVRADSVEKVFFGWRTKFLKAADAFCI